MAQPKPYNYYIGPWIWSTAEEGMWVPPTGTVGLIDLRSVSAAGKKDIPEGYGFFAVDGTLSAPYVLIASGYLDTATVSNPTKNAINTYIGYKPNGSTMLEVLWDICTNGGDPTGAVRLKPIMPTVQGNLELHLGGHSLVMTEKFVYGTHPHTAYVREVIKNDYRKIRAESVEQNQIYHLKVLDYLGGQFGVQNPENEFVPDDLPKEKPIPHDTTQSDNFDRADADAMGTSSEGWTWVEYKDDIDIVSNTAQYQSIATSGGGRPDTALSSSNNYAQVKTTVFPPFNSAASGTTCRQDTGNGSTVNQYFGRYAHNVGNPAVQLYVGINGALSSIGTTSQSATVPFTIKTSANGSTITVDLDGVNKVSVTNTQLSSGTYIGIRDFPDTSGNSLINVDDFTGGDIGGGTNTGLSNDLTSYIYFG